MPLWSRTHHETWAELRVRVIGALADLGAPATVADADARPVVSWVDGPGPGRLREALGEVPGWTVADGPPAPDVAGGDTVLYLDRTLSEQAIATCLVRFYASQGRHWSSSEGPAYQAAWKALAAADDPAISGFPIADAVAALLLEAPDPPGLPIGPTPADVLSAKLAAIGYERLWAVGFSSVS